MKFGTKSLGLGDILLLTSVCKYFPNHVTVQIDKEKSRFECLFYGLAKVELMDNKDIVELPNLGGGHYSTRKLRNFFGSISEGLDNRPLVLYSDMESERWAFNFLKDKPNPVIFVPTCSKQWSKVRNMPNFVISNTLNNLKADGHTPIICQSSDNKKDIEGINLIDLDLKKYICLLRRCGVYYGANTGDEHLATAVGCKTFVFQPEDSELFSSSEWNYNHLNSTYFIWNDNY